jgi:hypothetical protein
VTVLDDRAPGSAEPAGGDASAAEPGADGRARWWANRTLISLVVVLAGVLVANALPLTGILDADPARTRADLVVAMGEGWLPGEPTIDPNDGFTAQALGRQAAVQWLSGEIPYWNHYEGVGTPLAGGMQSAAFFLPFVLLQGLPDGLLYFHVSLQMLAAAGGYLLLRRLRVGHVVAVAGGIAFGVSGTMAWLTNAVFNPIAFLPWLVLGIELVLEGDDGGGGRDEASRRRRWLGTVVVALALSGSLYAGFPEMAYFDALLAYAWAALRLVERRHGGVRRRLGDLTVGTVAGLLLAAPVLTAFLTYLPDANTGPHDGAVGETSLGVLGLPALVLPYVYGPIFGFHLGDASGQLGAWWSNVGGFLTMSAVALAIIGLLGRRERGLKVLLAAWVAVCLAKTFGVPVVSTLVNLVPAVRYAAFYRYSLVMVEFAVIVLAALAIDGIVRGEVRRRAAVGGAAVSVGLVLVAAGMARGTVGQISAPHHRAWAVLSVALALSATAVILVACLLPHRRPRLRGALLAGVLVAESLVLFVVPQLSIRHDVVVDQAPVAFLQEHLGTASFATLGPIAPNYGSYFGIRAVNVNDLPVPQAYHDLVSERLNRNTPPAVFTGSFLADPSGPTGEEELVANLANYADAGVRFVVARQGELTAEEAGRAGLRAVSVGGAVEIFEVPGWKPYLEPAEGSGCRVESGDVTGALVDCPAPASLLRRELALPGWRATVNGEDVAVRDRDGLFQVIDLPAGRSRVAFSYRPPLAALSWALLAAGVLLLVLRSPWAARLITDHSTYYPGLRSRR